MTVAPSSHEGGTPTNGSRNVPTFPAWFLRVEAIVCFFWPILGLLSALIFWQFLDGLPGGREKLLNVGIVICGLAGLYGLFALTNAATHPDRRIRHPILLIASLCLGALACGAAVRRWDFGVLTHVILPLAAIGHFLYLTRDQWSTLTTSPAAQIVYKAIGRWGAVCTAAIAGAIVAGPRMGLQADYTIDPAVSRASLEAHYGPLLDQIETLSAPADASAPETAALVKRIAADPTIIYARLDAPLPNQSSAQSFGHMNRDIGEYQCYMRSSEMQSDGIIRCRMTSEGQLVDMLRYARYGLNSQANSPPTRNVELYLDYRRLLLNLQRGNSTQSD